MADVDEEEFLRVAMQAEVAMEEEAAEEERMRRRRRMFLQPDSDAKDGHETENAGGRRRGGTFLLTVTKGGGGPEVIAIAKVMHEYTTLDVGFIDIRPGNQVFVTDQSDVNWWRGYIAPWHADAEIGLFPSSYVTVVPEEPTRDTPSAARTASATVGAKPAEVLEDAGPEATTVRMRALYDYEVSDTDDGGKLSLNLGDTIIVTDTSDERWWFGHLEAQIDKAGFFPKDFVKLISDEEPSEDELPPEPVSTGMLQRTRSIEVFDTLAAHLMIGTDKLANCIAKFGARSAMLSGALAVRAQPIYADSDIQNAKELRGNIAVIERGEVSFATKARRAMKAGARAVIFVNSKDEPFMPFGDAKEDDPSADDDITIPLVCIAKSDFAKFFNTMRGVKMDSFVFGPQNKNAARALEEQAKDTRKKKTEKGKRKKKGGGCCAARPKNSR